MDPFLRRMLWNVLPAALVVVIIYLAVFGENGILRRHRMVAELEAAERRLEEVELVNARLRREVTQIRADDATVARVAAEELLLVPPGSTVYRFDR